MTDDELIAGFDDRMSLYVPKNEKYNPYYKRYTDASKTRLQSEHLVDELEYSINWNWLMPVVEKIERLVDVRVIIKGSRCRILCGHKIFSCHTISKLNSMYRVVADFIKWYNDASRK